MKAARVTSGTPAWLYLAVMIGLALTMAACDHNPEEQAVSLVDWSPDRSRAALVPNYMGDDPGAYGIWVYDFETGNTKCIFEAPKGAACTHPQWSPAGDELLFGMVLDADSNSPEGDGSVSFSVYAIRPDGRELRRLVDSRTASPEIFVMRNAMSWGPAAGAILFQQSVGDKITAMHLDLASGEINQYLPDLSDFYSLEPSPDRRLVAVLLYDKESDLARVYLADFAAADWRLLETLQVDVDRLGTHSQEIYWSPDSTKFAVPEKVKAASDEEDACGYLRVFDVVAQSSRRFPAREPSPAILWNQDSSALVFAVPKEPAAGIFRADLSSASVSMIVPGPENSLLSWNHQDGRIYFFRTSDTGATRPVSGERFEHRLFSCDTEGNGARTLGRFYTSRDPYWNLSPDGSQMVLFEDAGAPDLIYLTTGGADQIRFQGQPRRP